MEYEIMWIEQREMLVKIEAKNEKEAMKKFYNYDFKEEDEEIIDCKISDVEIEDEADRIQIKQLEHC